MAIASSFSRIYDANVDGIFRYNNTVRHKISIAKRPGVFGFTKSHVFIPRQKTTLFTDIEVAHRVLSR